MDLTFRILRPGPIGLFDDISPYIDIHLGDLVNQMEMEASALRYARRVPSSMLVGILVSARLRELFDDKDRPVPIDRWMEARGMRLLAIDAPEVMLTTANEGKVADRLFLATFVKEE